MGIMDKLRGQGSVDQPSDNTGYNNPGPAPADPLARVAEAEYNEGGVFILPGAYICCVDVVKTITSRKGDFLWIVQLEILESSTADRPAGTRMDWVANFKHDPTPGNVKGFISAAMDAPADEVTYEATKLVCSPSNPLHGRLVRVEATQIKTKANNDFTKTTFHAIPEEVQIQAAELRKAAGFTPF